MLEAFMMTTGMEFQNIWDKPRPEQDVRLNVDSMIADTTRELKTQYPHIEDRNIEEACGVLKAALALFKSPSDSISDALEMGKTTMRFESLLSSYGVDVQALPLCRLLNDMAVSKKQATERAHQLAAVLAKNRPQG